MSYNAEKEIKLACKRENPDWDGKSFDYGCSIYQNALECYEAIQQIIEKAGHSGFSYGMFVNIFARMLREQPLTPIVEEDFNEDFPEKLGLGERTEKDGRKVKQCVRYSSLFRTIYPDGKISYHDVDRIAVIDQNGQSWHSGSAEKKCADLIPPITLPYMPTNHHIEIYVWQFTYDPTSNPSIRLDWGTFNSEYIEKIVFPDGKVINVNRLYLDDKLVNDYSEEMFEEIRRVTHERTE